MEYHEEEGEIIPDCVINYYVVDGNNQPVSFSVLPLLWSEDETPGNSDTQIFLCGTAVTGQKMYKKVIAWRPEISYALPMIYVLSKDKTWMQLQKPRRSFEDAIMSTLITVHCLHFLKWNLKADASALWTQLHKAFSTYEVGPSKSHLLCHLPLIEEAAKRDRGLAKSELLPTLLLETPTCEVNRATKKLNFEVDSQADYEENDSDDDDETHDSVCVLCDNGGEILCCEDKCLRSFHPNINAGVDSSCESLGYSDAQVEAIQTFFCNNCQYQQHQCFVCGKLGSSDQSSVPEVFQCANADCGHFYHPNCVAELLQPCDTFNTKELQLKIYSGESFVCPAHKCNICMKGEDKTVHELQFAMCRRCPKAYHRKCLPSEIAFQSDGNMQQRAWDGLLSNRVLIYCMDHEILSEIGTPKRDHIIFPNVEGIMQTTLGLLSSKEKLIKSRDMGTFTMRSPLKNTGGDEAVLKVLDRARDLYRNKLQTSNAADELASLFAECAIAEAAPSRTEPSQSSTMSQSFEADAQGSSILAEAGRKQIMLDAFADISPQVIQLFSQAVQTALKILNDGGKVEDAKAVCEQQVLKQLVRWKKQLDIYLAPVLHGNRYTSFGRHFTNMDKLELIVDKLKWYVQDGDTIVDFSCGSNDFSCLMRERLHKMGNICSFKNYDLFTPKNDFNFEQKDWMTVTLEELPAGSNLIMGLNPPFGVNGHLANKFIDKALTFKPKLLIVIVPLLTERLDRKRKLPYDIIWEDHCLLSGKAFYLPGSVDVNDKQLEQHNRLAPPLYLWSRPDWTAQHKQIAETLGHVTVANDPLQMGKMDTGENHDGMYDEDMEVDLPVHLPCYRADLKNSFDWSLMGSYPSHYTTGMQYSYVVSDAAAMGMQHPSVVSDAMRGVYHEVLPQHPSVVLDAMQGVEHEVLPQHPSVVSDAVDGVHHGAFPPPCQYPSEPYV